MRHGRCARRPARGPARGSRRALLVPTRELATQVQAVLSPLADAMGLIEPLIAELTCLPCHEPRLLHLVNAYVGSPPRGTTAQGTAASGDPCAVGRSHQFRLLPGWTVSRPGYISIATLEGTPSTGAMIQAAVHEVSRVAQLA
jgi:hypothetical protein